VRGVWTSIAASASTASFVIAAVMRSCVSPFSSPG
jgi:hypothetical protein